MPQQRLTAQGICSYFVLMLGRGKKALWTVGDAQRTGQIFAGRCHRCSTEHWYHPDDLLRLLGNIPTDNLWRGMRCGRCWHHLEVEIANPPAEARQRIKLRRLDRIWWVRRVSWRDER